MYLIILHINFNVIAHLVCFVLCVSAVMWLDHLFTGGRDTAGLGGKGGPYRLDSGHMVYQVSQAEKDSIPEEVRRAAREMAEKAFKDRYVFHHQKIQQRYSLMLYKPALCLCTSHFFRLEYSIGHPFTIKAVPYLISALTLMSICCFVSLA